MVAKPSFALQPNCAENLDVQMDSPVRPWNTIDLWIQLFSNILGDEQLTKELWNTRKGTVEAEGIPEEPIIVNLLERHTSRIQRRK
jgi:hypothetical protein